MRFVGHTVNTYFGMLVIAVIASGAVLLIVHIATARQYPVLDGSAAEYTPLKQSILESQDSSYPTGTSPHSPAR
ncbi:MAG: hypothetical protein Q8P36_01125 [bacterium]|nr:hypothetical protein [bacterium]